MTSWTRETAAALTLLAVLACGAGPGKETASPGAVGVTAGAAVEVETAVARRGTVLPRLLAPGSIIARRTSQIGAEVTGRIERVLVDVGDRVETGDLLFEIDPSTFEAAARQAEAALELTRAERRQMASDLERARELRQKDVLSEQGFEQIETQLTVARAREQEAKAALAIARESLAKTRVFAPYAGTVAKRLADEGTTARAMPQTIVVELQETGDLEAVSALPELVHARVHIGDRALLTVEGLPEPVETRVFSVADTIDSMTRTFLVRMRVPNPDHRIKAGVFARVEIFSNDRVDTLLIPREAVRSEAGRTSVLVVRGGKAIEVPVRLGIVSEDAIEVLSGLDEGGEVIVGEAALDLAPGTAVTPRSATGRPHT